MSCHIPISSIIPICCGIVTGIISALNNIFLVINVDLCLSDRPRIFPNTLFSFSFVCESRILSVKVMAHKLVFLQSIRPRAVTVLEEKSTSVAAHVWNLHPVH